MKAIRAHAFGGPDVLQLDDGSDPVPGPGEVVANASIELLVSLIRGIRDTPVGQRYLHFK